MRRGVWTASRVGVTALAVSWVWAAPVMAQDAAPVKGAGKGDAAPAEAKEVLTVMLRAGDARRAGWERAGVESLSAAGVTIRQRDADGKMAATVIGWDRVGSIEGAAAGTERAASITTWLEGGQDLWRARERLERGDVPGAEPLFERVMPMFAREEGPTAAIASAGLVRCRLARGVQTLALEPWLVWVGSGVPISELFARSEDREALERGLEFDAELGLVSSLPPIWQKTPAVQALARGETLSEVSHLSEDAGPARRRASRLAGLYLAAARGECGLEVGDLSLLLRIEGNDPGLSLVSSLVAARLGDESTRAKARSELRGMIEARSGGWVEAWVRVGIGRSLLLEPDEESRLMGIAELLHVPARLERHSAALTALALAEASAALEAMGDSAGAAKLKQELVVRYPNSSSTDWLLARGTASDVPAKAPAGVKGEGP
ncbi:MAG: hypothetical protein IPK69_10045 [Phycisphaerales bacterium]|nr:MAG: hypothetical protein IPK69_10045 [Phycisphaerales bacterium]